MWLALAPVLAVLAAAAIGAMPTKALASGKGPPEVVQAAGVKAMTAMGVACGMSILATVLGSVPAIWAALRSPDKLIALALGATVLRVAILAVLVVPVVIFSELPLLPFLLWVAISYAVALAAESVSLVLLIRRMETHK